MNATIVIYGSSTGTCEAIAEKIALKLGCKALNVQDLTADIVSVNQNLILGTSTWGAGELQDDWYDRRRHGRTLQRYQKQWCQVHRFC